VIRELFLDEEVRKAFGVMRQLRPHLEEEEFVLRVREQRANGYRLTVVEEGGEVRAAAGFRVMDMLVQGRHLYVDDLVTDETRRSKGHGGLLFDWLMDEARRSGCATLELDSGVQRLRAHAFYFAKRMHIAGYHFRIDVR
jgi:GNAT superfamily N-acetyltransferase